MGFEALFLLLSGIFGYSSENPKDEELEEIFEELDSIN